MKTVNKSLEQITAKVAQNAQTGSYSKTSERKSWFDTPEEFEAKFKAVWRILYGMKVISFETTDTDYTIWKRTLADLAAGEFDRGLREMRDYTGTWLTAPQFKAMCKFSDSDLGIPPMKQAYYEACMAASPKNRQKYSHPIVYFAGVATGWFDLAKLPEGQIIKKFEYNYDVLKRRVANGEELSIDVPAAIPSKITRKLTLEEHDQQIKNILGMFKNAE